MIPLTTIGALKLNRFVLFLLLGFVLLPVTNLAQTLEGTYDPSTGWRSVRVNRDGFQALFPGRVKVTLDVFETNGMKIPLKLYESEGEFGSYVALVLDMTAISDYLRDSSFRDKLVSQSIDDFQKGFSSNAPSSLKIGSPRPTSSGAFQGRAFPLTLFNNPAGEARYFVTSDRLYAVFALDISDNGAVNVARMMSSFTIF